MKKLSFLLLFLFLISAQPFFFNITDYSPGISLSSGNPGVDQGTPVSLKTSADWDNIDSFDVHPMHRWTILNTGFDSATISDGIFNLTDTGDGSADHYRMNRNLRDLSGTAEMRFKFDTDSGTYNYYQSFYLFISDQDYTNYAYFQVYGLNDGTTSDYTKLAYKNMDGATETYFVNKTTEGCYDNVWYTIRMDYNLPKSEFRWQLYYDNGTRLFSYHWYDIDEDNPPALFGHTNLMIRYQPYNYVSGTTSKFYVDYIHAPFVEQQWNRAASGGDADWLEDNAWDHVVMQDDISAQAQNWTLVVPNLDAASGVAIININDNSYFSNSDYLDLWFEIKNVAWDDGATDLVFEVRMRLQKDAGGNVEYQYLHAMGDRQILNTGYTSYNTDSIFVTFAFATYDDRQYASARALFGWDRTDETKTIETLGDALLTDCIDDPSHEYIIEIYYGVNLFGNAAEGEMWIESFDYASNDFLKELGELILKGPIAYFTGKIVEGLDSMLIAGLQAILDGLGKFIGMAFDVTLAPLLEQFDEWTGGWVTTLVNWIGGFSDWWSNLWTEVSNHISNIYNDIITHGLTILSDVADFVLGIFIQGWADEGGPNVLAAIEKVWTQFTSAVNDIPAGLDDIKSYINFWASWLVIFLTALALGYPLLSYAKDGNAGTYLREFLDLQVKNVLPIGIFGWHIHFPFGLLWFPLFLFELGWSG